MKTRRNLSGIYFRSQNAESGKWENVVFEDLPESEQDEILNKASNEWLKSMIKSLCKTINHIGDSFDLMC